MTSAGLQLLALIALRWQMVRSTGVRIVLLGVALLLGWLVPALSSGGASLDLPVLAAAVELAPAAFLGFAALAVVAPLTAGGGNEMVPANQLVAQAVRPATQFLGGLVLAPLNLVWVVQLLGLAALTGAVSVTASLSRGAVVTTAYIALLTVAGQACAWVVVGLRQTRRGRRLVAAVAVLLLTTGIACLRAGKGDELLSHSPTRTVVEGISTESGLRWTMTTAALWVLVLVAVVAGCRACTWALARPGDATTPRHLARVRRRSTRRSSLRELVAVDRASVWRSPALRRGGLVLAVLPGLLAAGAAIPWASLIVLPGLVAAGAGLLFGINAFCLDGSGALWLASLPSSPALVARAKALVIGETVLAAAAVVAVAGALRSPGLPTSSESVAIVVASITCSAVVVAQCLRTSVLHPSRADLAGPRDAVASPGSLALASVRLAVPAALIGAVVAAAGATAVWWLPIAFGLPIVLAAALSLLRSLRRYDDPLVRSRVVQVVAAG